MVPDRLSKALRIVVLAIAGTIAALDASAAPPPADAFATLPHTSDTDLSPNGQLLAWADRSGSQERVVIFDLAASRTKLEFAIDTTMKLRDLGWSDNETVLLDVSLTMTKASGTQRRFEFFRTLAGDVNSAKTKMLLMADGLRGLVAGAALVARRTTKPKKVVMSTWDWSSIAVRRQIGTFLAGQRGDSGWVSSLFEVDTQTGKGKAIDEGSKFTEEWIVDADGRAVARSEWKPRFAEYQILAKRNGGWKTIYDRKRGGPLALTGLTADATAIVAIGANEAARSVLWAIALDGSGARVLFEDPIHDVTAVVQDRFTNAPIGVRLGGPEQAIRWFDKEAQARFERVARAFKNRSVQIYGRSQDNKRLLARVGSPSHPAIYYLVDFTTHNADIVGHEYPALTDVALGEVRSMTFKARDGTAIPAYLTLPPGASPKSLPLVVLPHGGPESRDNYAFDWWAQFLATRGYAVLQPQFRGSTGFGETFRLAGRRQWGGLMQDDVTDGVRAMIEEQIADARRVGIVGASYGGYAALAGAAFTPELYKCAVSVNGVSDLPEMLEVVRARSGAESDAAAYWRDTVGSAFDKNVIERSPARAAERIQIPILLMHGVDDSVVPIAQSEAMAHALGKLNKKFSFIKLSGEDHWLSRGETRLKVLTEIEKFLAENL